MWKRELSRTYGPFLKFWLRGTLHHKATKDTKGAQREIAFLQGQSGAAGNDKGPSSARPSPETERNDKATEGGPKPNDRGISNGQVPNSEVYFLVRSRGEIW